MHLNNRKTVFPDAHTLIAIASEMAIATKAILDMLDAFAAGPQKKPVSADIGRLCATAQLISLRSLVKVGEEACELAKRIEDANRAETAEIQALQGALGAIHSYLRAAMSGKVGPGILLYPTYADLMRCLPGRIPLTRGELFLPVSPVYGVNSPTYNEGRFIAEIARYYDEYKQSLARYAQHKGIEAVNAMRTTLATMEAKNPPANLRMFFSLAVAFMDIAVRAGGKISRDDEALLARIDRELVLIQKAELEVDEGTISWFMYVVAQAPQFSTRIRTFHDTYDLPRMIEQEQGGALSEQTLAALASAFDSTKKTWEREVTPTGNLAAVSTACYGLVSAANAVSDPALKTLAQAVASLSDGLTNLAVPPSPDIAMFGASVLLALGERLDRLAAEPKGGRAQADFHQERVRKVLAGQSPTTLPAAMPSDSSFGRSFLDETLNDITLVEQILDQSVRDGARAPKLGEASKLLKSIAGALTLINLEEGSHYARLVDGFMMTVLQGLLDKQPVADDDKAKLADVVMMLHRYVSLVNIDAHQAQEALQRGLRLLGAAEDAPRAAAEPASEYTDWCQDDELGPIFFEEAQEILAQNILPGLAKLANALDDHATLLDVRRGFHTIKGSARMVGLNHLGTVAEQAEYTLNHFRDHRERTIKPNTLVWLKTCADAIAASLSLLRQEQPAPLDPRPFIDAYQSFTEGGDAAARPTEPRVPVPAPAAPTQASESAPGLDQDDGLLDLVLPDPTAWDQPTTATGPATPAAVTAPSQPAASDVMVGSVTIAGPMFAAFAQEAKQFYSALEQALLFAVQGKVRRLDYETMRMAHSLAGMGRATGLLPISGLAAAIEQWIGYEQSLDRDLDLTQDAKQALGDALEALDAMIEGVLSQVEPVAEEGVIARLQALMIAPEATAKTPAEPAVESVPEDLLQLGDDLEAVDHAPADTVEETSPAQVEQLTDLEPIAPVQPAPEPQDRELALLEDLAASLAADDDLAATPSPEEGTVPPSAPLAPPTGEGTAEDASGLVDADADIPADSAPSEAARTIELADPAPETAEPPNPVDEAASHQAIGLSDAPHATTDATATPLALDETSADALPDAQDDPAAIPDHGVDALDQIESAPPVPFEAMPEVDAPPQLSPAPDLDRPVADDQAPLPVLDAPMPTEADTQGDSGEPLDHDEADPAATDAAPAEKMLLGDLELVAVHSDAPDPAPDPLNVEEALPATDAAQVGGIHPGEAQTALGAEPEPVSTGTPPNEGTYDATELPMSTATVSDDPPQDASADAAVAALDAPAAASTSANLASPAGESVDAATPIASDETKDVGVDWMAMIAAKNDDVDPEMFEYFWEEADVRFAEIDEAMTTLAEAGNDRRKFDALKRAVHTLKGSANTAGARKVGAVFHYLEDLMNGIDEMTHENLAVIQQGVDAGYAAIKAVRDGDSVEQVVESVLARRHKTVHTGTETASDLSTVAPPVTSEQALFHATEGPARNDTAGDNSASSGAANESTESSTDSNSSSTVESAGESVGEDAVKWGSVQVIALDPQHAAQIEAAAEAATPKRGIARQKDDDDNTLRVSSRVLDNMVKNVGEINITRNRMGMNISTCKTSLTGLAASLEQMYGYLREVEREAEKQMAAGAIGIAGSPVTAQFDALQLDRFTRLQELTRRVNEAQNDIMTQQGTALHAMRDIEDAVAAQHVLVSDLGADLDQIRQVRVSSIVPLLKRVMRAACRDTGKKAEIYFDADVEIDRGILDKLTNALEHLLRNAVAHGIEMPEDRAAASKDESGTVEFRAYQDGGEVVIEIRDDGRGIDPDRVLRRAIERGLVAEGAKLNEHQIQELLFEPGFSTAPSVTDIAGRGVGLDVVRSDISSMGGRVSVHSTPGASTTFTLHVPSTITVLSGAAVLTNGHMYVIPVSFIDRLMRVGAAELESAYRTGKLLVQSAEDDAIEYDFCGLWQLAGLEEGDNHATARNSILLMRGDRLAVHVDEMQTADEFVLRPMGPQIAPNSGLIGSTINAQGNAALVMNPAQIMRRLRNGRDGDLFADGTERSKRKDKQPLILIVDDSLTVRKATARLLKKEGFRYMDAVDGLEALQRMQEELPDLILMDVEMPNMNGYELTKNIRTTAAYSHIPIVMITSRVAEIHRQQAIDLGVNAYLGKPFNDDDVLEHIRRLTGTTANLDPQAAL